MKNDFFGFKSFVEEVDGELQIHSDFEWEATNDIYGDGEKSPEFWKLVEKLIRRGTPDRIAVETAKALLNC